MTMYAVSSTVQVLAVIGLALRLVVIWLLHSTLAPLRKVSADVQQALTAPMLERAVPGTDQLGQTRRLAWRCPTTSPPGSSRSSWGSSWPSSSSRCWRG
jgi:hypothetical protein